MRYYVFTWTDLYPFKSTTVLRISSLNFIHSDFFSAVNCLQQGLQQRHKPD